MTIGKNLEVMPKGKRMSGTHCGVNKHERGRQHIKACPTAQPPSKNGLARASSGGDRSSTSPDIEAGDRIKPVESMSPSN